VNHGFDPSPTLRALIVLPEFTHSACLPILYLFLAFILHPRGRDIRLKLTHLVFKALPPAINHPVLMPTLWQPDETSTTKKVDVR
jgi:hypothetical protein